MKITLRILTIIIFTSLSLPPQSNAQMMDKKNNHNTSEFITTEDNHHQESLNQVVEKLLQRQQINSIEEIDCARLSDDELEKTGDAWMEASHPGDAHERMDTMMGGEGSQNLRAMHINMGNNYLGCASTSSSFSNMIGPGMMMGALNPNWRSMGFTANSQWPFFTPMILIYLLVVVLLLVMIRYFYKKGGERKK